MHRRHAVTLGMGVAGLVAMALLSGCGEATFGTCQDTNSCVDGSAGDTAAVDQFTGDSPSGEAGTIEAGTREGGGEGGEGGEASEAACIAPTTLECGEGCVDPTLPSHCGSCEHVCFGPEAGVGHAVCQPAGLCAVACDSDADDGGALEILCNAACVSPDDVGHCGTCANPCALPPSGKGSPTCPAAQCVMTCLSGYHPGGADCNADCLANTDDPGTDPCVAVDGLGAFVSPTGNDTTGDGTKEHPFGSIGHAMDTSGRVYACGTFTGEQLIVSGTTRDGTSVYGGFDCATWTYSAGTKTKLAPTAVGFALQVDGLIKGATFEDFEFDAVAATAAGGSSQAVLVNASQDVTFRRCAFAAGSASVTGATGTNGANTWSGLATMGNSASTTSADHGGGTQLNCTCGGSGGAGGNAGTWNSTTILVSQAGATGGAGTIGAASNGGSGEHQGATLPLTVVACVPGTVGNPGTPGIGGAGSTSLGALGATGWSNAGGVGALGQPAGAAQGGGGGGGGLYDPTLTPNGAGGSAGGGCGGCGGAGAASGGSPGGSSIALVAITSTVTVDTCTLTAAAGGAGGQEAMASPGNRAAPPEPRR